MALRFFADHCISNSVVADLRAAGYQVDRLRDHIRLDSPDPDVLAKVQELEAVLVSLDGDFSDIVTYPPQQYRGIIALQVRNHPEVLPQIMARLLTYLAAQPDASHYHGKLLLVEPHRIRIRA